MFGTKSLDLSNKCFIFLFVVVLLFSTNASAFGGSKGRVSSTRVFGVDSIGVHYDPNDDKPATSNKDINLATCAEDGQMAYCAEKSDTGSCISIDCCDINVSQIYLGKGLNGADLCCSSGVSCVEDNPDGSCAYCRCGSQRVCLTTKKHYCYRRDVDGLCIGSGCCGGAVFRNVGVNGADVCCSMGEFFYEGSCVENKCRHSQNRSCLLDCDPLTGVGEPDPDRDGEECEDYEGNVGICSNGVCVL